MLTKNWYNCFKMLFAGYYNATDNASHVTRIDGSKYYARTPSSGTSFSNAVYGFFPPTQIHGGGIASNDGDNGIHFGSGSTPPTLDDYCLESKISTLTGRGCTYAIRTVGNRHEVDALFTVQNTGTESVTVREVGWVSNNQVTTYQYSQNLLFDRTVLDAPVTIAPGETAVIKYTLGVTLPF